MGNFKFVYLCKEKKKYFNRDQNLRENINHLVEKQIFVDPEVYKIGEP